MVGFKFKKQKEGFGPKNVPGSWGLKDIFLLYSRMAELKKCTNCTRGLQPIHEFVNEKGRECSTCNKCRTKGKKYDAKPERREAHNELQKEKEYYKEWRAKQLEERPDEFRQHNNQVHSTWRAENAEHSANWYRTNVNHRLDALKRAAIIRGIEWKLSNEDAKEMLTSPCVYCKHIDLEVRVNGIDRLDSNVCYTVENCRPCCKNCNYMKGTYDPITFINLAKRIALCDAVFPEVPLCDEHKRVNRKKTTPLHQPTQSKSPETHTTECLSRDQPDPTETNVEPEDR